jgi:hypothetical protein
MKLNPKKANQENPQIKKIKVPTISIAFVGVVTNKKW